MKILILICWTLIPSCVMTQPAAEADIRFIRNRFSEVNDLAAQVDPQIFPVEVSEGGEIRIYKGETGVLKVSTEYFGETGRYLEDYYFDQNGNLIFVFTQGFKYNRPFYYTEEDAKESGDTEWFDPDKTTVSENRYYFKDETLIRWLDPNKKEVSSTHEEYAGKYQYFWEEVYRLIESPEAMSD